MDSAGKVLVLQHDDCGGPGLLAGVLETGGFEMELLRPDQGDKVPLFPAGYSALVVTGGPQAVYELDKYPYLADELRLLTAARVMRLPVMGICLGAQLLAAACGARVQAAEKEIGWHPVALNAAGRADPLFEGTAEGFYCFHWHSDSFELPEGAQILASSELTANQAFRAWDWAYGLQFHLEVTRPIVQDLLRESMGDLPVGSVVAAEIVDGNADYGANEQRAQRIFARWLLGFSGLLDQVPGQSAALEAPDELR